MFYTMSAVTNQPLPFGGLEREKHIQMIFRAFQNRCAPSCEAHSHTAGPKRHQKPPDWESDEQLPGPDPGRKLEKGFMQPAAGKVSRSPAAGSHCPQCVPRRIYSITTGSSRSQLCVAVEESSCVCLQCCGPARACSVQGFNCQGRQVFYFERPLRVDACCLGCCLMEMRAYTPQKHLIGSIRQRWSMFTPLLEVCDSDGASSMRIQGSCCPYRCLSNQQFQIVSNIGEKIGTIWKKWPGFNDEHNMDHEYFGLEVPLSMDSKTKLLLLAATFLLNYMFFEMS